MWVIDIEAAPPRLRGRLSRWAVEVRAGLYVGSTSAKVRDAVWELLCKNLTEEANAVLVYDARNTQGFEARTAGKNRRIIEQVDGLILAMFTPVAVEEKHVFQNESVDDEENDDENTDNTT